MKHLHGKKIVASYSGGKDSALALHRALQAGLVPLGLLTTYNIDLNRSWFHGMTEATMEKVSASLALPITLVKTSGELYHENFERALLEAKSQGAEVCVFGDIDIEDHLQWCTARCEAAGLIPYFPLWKEDRKKLVYEFIDSGFSAIITVLDTAVMPREFLGQVLTRETAEAIEKSGADICGENGEYHTFAFDGPIFRRRVDFPVIGRLDQGKFAVLNIG